MTDVRRSTCVVKNRKSALELLAQDDIEEDEASGKSNTKAKTKQREKGNAIQHKQTGIHIEAFFRE